MKTFGIWVLISLEIFCSDVVASSSYFGQEYISRIHGPSDRIKRGTSSSYLIYGSGAGSVPDGGGGGGLVILPADSNSGYDDSLNSKGDLTQITAPYSYDSGSLVVEEAEKAANKAYAAAANLNSAASSAASAASQKAAFEATLAAQKAHQAASTKFSETTRISKAAMAANQAAKEENNQLQKLARVLQSAKGSKQTAEELADNLAIIRAEAEEQTLQSAKALRLAQDTFQQQQIMAWEAQKRAQTLRQKEAAARSSLAASKAAASQAAVLANKAISQAESLSYYDDDGYD